MPDRSAETGEYVSAEEAKANPATTVHETDAPRAPRDAKALREVAELLLDIADGKWTLTNAVHGGT